MKRMNKGHVFTEYWLRLSARKTRFYGTTDLAEPGSGAEMWNKPRHQLQSHCSGEFIMEAGETAAEYIIEIEAGF
jgi:hypothetical protein